VFVSMTKDNLKYFFYLGEMKFILCFLFTMAIFSGHSQAVKKDRVITGRIYSNINPQFYNVVNVSVIIRCDNKPFDTVQTNDKGQFLVIIPPDKQKEIDIIYSGLGFESVYLRHLHLLSADTTNLLFDVGKSYEKNIFGKATCPKCSKSDRVYAISYSDAPVFSIRVSNSGDTTYSPLYKGTYQAGCLSSAQSAQWYCDRDKIQF